MTKQKLKRPPTVGYGFNIEGNFSNLGEMTVELAERYGDIVRVSRLQRWYFINHPDYIRRVLLDNQSNYTKINAGFKRISAIFGKGLLTVTDANAWQRQHDLLKKMFQLKQLPAMAEVVARHLAPLSKRLDNFIARDRVFNLSAELMGIVVRASAEALFGKQFDEMSSYQIIQDLELCNRYVSFGLAPNIMIPTLGNLQFHLARKRLRKVVKDIISAGQAQHNPPENLLTLLLSGSKADNSMTMQEVEDQVFTFLVTGHETTGSLLSWVFLCLHQHPEVKQKLRASLVNELHGQVPRFEQLDQLEYLQMVLDETLRLYPSIWHIVRRGTDADQLGDYPIPKGSSIIISQYALHRHPKFWPAPDEFKPERFEKSVKHARLSYLPFGFGPRTCIAATMAMLQAKIILGYLVQHYDFNVFDPERVRKEFLISMRPKDGIRAVAQRLPNGRTNK